LEKKSLGLCWRLPEQRSSSPAIGLTTDDMIADLIAGLLMLGFGVTILLMWSFQR